MPASKGKPKGKAKPKNMIESVNGKIAEWAVYRQPARKEHGQEARFLIAWAKDGGYDDGHPFMAECASCTKKELVQEILDTAMFRTVGHAFRGRYATPLEAMQATNLYGFFTAPIDLQLVQCSARWHGPLVPGWEDESAEAEIEPAKDFPVFGL